jgi:hypothetical protein
VLGVVASPADLTPLDVERERRLIDDALGTLKQTGAIEIGWLVGRGIDELRQALHSGSWHVLHFVGHGHFDPLGGEGLIALVNEDGSTLRLQATQFARLLADHDSLRLAVLNSCEGASGSGTTTISSTASLLIKRGLPAVVAMQSEITDRSAITFARTFYQHLAQSTPIDAAITEARKTMSLDAARPEWGTPVLFLRTQDGVLFDMSEDRLPPRSPFPPDRSLPRRLALLSLPTVVLAVGALALTAWRLPTRVAIDLVTSRVAFTVRGPDVALIEGSPSFSRLVSEGCESATITGASVSAVFPGADSPAAEHLGDVLLTCPDPAARLILEGIGDQPAAIGSFDRFRLPDGTAVTLTAVPDSAMPTITIDMLAAVKLDLGVSRELQVITDFVRVPEQLGAAGVLRVRPMVAPTWFALRTRDRTTLSVTPSTPAETSFFPERIRIPIEDPQFVQDRSTGLVSSLLGSGALTYSEYPNLPGVGFDADDFVQLHEAAELEISRIAFSTEPPGLALRVEGVVHGSRIGRPATDASTGGGRWRDPRLTAYDVARQTSAWQLVAGVIAWAATTSWAWYDGWRRLTHVGRAADRLEDG